MKKNIDNRVPFLLIHPGELLQDELDARGISQLEFSEIIDRPARTINEIIKGKRSITPETAQIIGAALGTSGDLWLRLQAKYDLVLLRKKTLIKEEEVKERAKLYSQFPVLELVKRGYLSKKRKVDELQKGLVDLFKIKDLDSFFTEEKYAHFSRTTEEGEIDTVTKNYLNTWINLGILEASKIKVGKFDPKKLESFAPEIKSFSLYKDGIKTVFDKLNEIGVRVIILPHFSKTRVDGAATWLPGKQEPIILMSGRYDRIDNFYFTLLHEIAHILKHPGVSFWDDISNLLEDKREREADQFATDALGLNDVVTRFANPGNSIIDLSLIKTESKDFMVHPGLLVGRLQHEKVIDYGQFRQALIKIKETIPSQYVSK